MKVLLMLTFVIGQGDVSSINGVLKQKVPNFVICERLGKNWKGIIKRRFGNKSYENSYYTCEKLNN